MVCGTGQFPIASRLVFSETIGISFTLCRVCRKEFLFRQGEIRVQGYDMSACDEIHNHGCSVRQEMRRLVSSCDGLLE